MKGIRLLGPIGLIGLIAAGFFIYRGQTTTPPPSQSSSLKLYSLSHDNTLTPPKTLFKASDPVTFVLTFEKKPTAFRSFIKPVFAQENPISAQLTFNNEESKEVSLEIKPLEKDKFSFSLQPKIPGQLQPGKYQLKVNREENGQTQTLTQDFSWGVLALNPSKSIYLPGEVAKLGIGVLNDTGRTICDAKVTLEITDPDGIKTTLSEANRFLRKSGQCQETSVTNIPDYLAGYKVGKAGVYKMHLEADNGNGVRSLDDSFEVRESVPFDIERADFPMRIYPPAEYTGTITVTANQDFKGEVVETVPTSFEIKQSTNYQLLAAAEGKKITWNVNWKKGEKYELSYSIKFPQISPEFYLIGPLRLADARSGSSTPEVFREARQWQITSDAITTKWMESGTDATQGFQFWQSTGGTTDTAISSDTTVAKTGPRSIKVSSGTANGTSFAENRTGFSDTGTRVSAYFYFDDLPTSNISILRITNSTYNDIATIRLNSTGTLSVLNSSALGTGSTTLSADTWYRISIAYVITSTTDFDIKVFINGTPEIILSDSATLTYTSTNRMRIGWNAAPGAGEKVLHFDDIYIDNGTDATDPGDIRVTAKLPNTVNNNGFDTTTGTGAVNERPLSTTNRMTDTTSNTPGALQDYTLQTAATGDVDLSSSQVVTLVARTAWVWASRQSSCTVTTEASIIDNGTETTITLTTSAAFYSVITDSGSYPSNAQGIGMRAVDGTCDTAFSEGGTLIAYKPVTNVQLQGIQMQGIQIK